VVASLEQRMDARLELVLVAESRCAMELELLQVLGRMWDFLLLALGPR